MKPQISSGLLVSLMNHYESFDELSQNFKHVIKYKIISESRLEYIPVYLIIFFFQGVTFWGIYKPAN